MARPAQRRHDLEAYRKIFRRHHSFLHSFLQHTMELHHQTTPSEPVVAVIVVLMKRCFGSLPLLNEKEIAAPIELAYDLLDLFGSSL